MDYQEVKDKLEKVFINNKIQVGDQLFDISFLSHSDSEIIYITTRNITTNISDTFVFHATNSIDYLEKEYRKFLSFLHDQKFIDFLEDTYFIL